MKRAKKHERPKQRDPVARSPLLRKGGVHEKSGGAKRRAASMATRKLERDPDLDG